MPFGFAVGWRIISKIPKETLNMTNEMAELLLFLITHLLICIEEKHLCIIFFPPNYMY